MSIIMHKISISLKSNAPTIFCAHEICETVTYLSPCLAIFRIRLVTRNSLRLLPGYILYTSVTRAFY